MITSYKDLTIKKYQEIRDILENDGGELNIQASIIACLCDMDVDSVYELNLTKYHELANNTAFLMNKPVIDGKVPSKIIINGKEYVLTTKVNKLTAGQYIDYQTLTAMPNQEKYLANILACFIVPKGCKYGEGYDTDELVNWITNNMSIQDAMNICFFFRKKYLKSIKLTLTYLELQMRMMKWKMKTEETKEKMKEVTKLLKQYRILLEESGAGSQW